MQGARRFGKGWHGEPYRHYLASKGVCGTKKFKRWRQLVNMSPSELREFKNSPEGRKAGLSREEAQEQGIKSGQESADAILRMQEKSCSEWTERDKEWMNRQLSFIARMRGVKGPLMKGGEPTRKHTALKIWGHDPMQKLDGV